MFGPQRAGVMFDELPTRASIPQAPFPVASRGGESVAVGTPRERVATVGVGRFETMQGTLGRRVEKEDLAGDG